MRTDIPDVHHTGSDVSDSVVDMNSYLNSMNNAYSYEIENEENINTRGKHIMGNSMVSSIEPRKFGKLEDYAPDVLHSHDIVNCLPILSMKDSGHVDNINNLMNDIYIFESRVNLAIHSQLEWESLIEQPRNMREYKKNRLWNLSNTKLQLYYYAIYVIVFFRHPESILRYGQYMYSYEEFEKATAHVKFVVRKEVRRRECKTTEHDYYMGLESFSRKERYLLYYYRNVMILLALVSPVKRCNQQDIDVSMDSGMAVQMQHISQGDFNKGLFIHTSSLLLERKIHPTGGKESKFVCALHQLVFLRLSTEMNNAVEYNMRGGTDKVLLQKLGLDLVPPNSALNTNHSTLTSERDIRGHSGGGCSANDLVYHLPMGTSESHHQLSTTVAIINNGMYTNDVGHLYSRSRSGTESPVSNLIPTDKALLHTNEVHSHGSELDMYALDVKESVEGNAVNEKDKDSDSEVLLQLSDDVDAGGGDMSIGDFENSKRPCRKKRVAPADDEYYWPTKLPGAYYSEGKGGGCGAGERGTSAADSDEMHRVTSDASIVSCLSVVSDGGVAGTDSAIGNCNAIFTASGKVSPPTNENSMVSPAAETHENHPSLSIDIISCNNSNNTKSNINIDGTPLQNCHMYTVSGGSPPKMIETSYNPNHRAVTSQPSIVSSDLLYLNMKCTNDEFRPSTYNAAYVNSGGNFAGSVAGKNQFKLKKNNSTKKRIYSLQAHNFGLVGSDHHIAGMDMNKDFCNNFDLKKQKLISNSGTGDGDNLIALIQTLEEQVIDI